MTAYVLRAVALLVAALLQVAPSHAQQSARVPRIGFVMPGSAEASAGLINAFRQGLQELGYVEGQNIQIDFRWQPADRPDLLPGIVSELVRSNPDVLVGPTTPQALALKKATSTIPIVMVVPSDPIGTGLVQTLARPGGNVTGLSLMSNDIMAKRLELLKETVPKISRVGDIWNPANPATQRDFKEIEIAARKLGLTIHSAEVRGPNDFNSAFSSLTRARVDALILQTDQLTWIHRQQIAKLTVQNRLPTIFFAREYVDGGGLMSYGASLADLYRRSASYVDKILAGASPAELPVEQPTKFELVVNLNTAKALGITIPEAILLRANEVLR
jgi:putative tryptophan/tyrosine transport system substrate-binding protein